MQEKIALNEWEKTHDDSELSVFNEATIEVKDRMFAAILEETSADAQPVSIRPVGWSLWSKVVAAAAALLLFSFVGLYVYQSKFRTDLQPKPDQVEMTLELSSGEKIDLASLEIGKEVDANGLRFEKNDLGELVFKQPVANIVEPDEIHTIQTHAGKHLTVNLLDGTKVWLSANSSMRFKGDFLKGDLRSVHMDGEAYFEVAPLAGKKFIVHSGVQQLTVKGTHFNIRSYKDEAAITTTLLEGAVELAHIENGTVLSRLALTPGTQAVLEGHQFHKTSVNTTSATSWINGLYTFEQESVQNLALKLHKWYAVELVFDDEDVANIQLSGTIPLDYTVEEALHVLALTGEIKYVKTGNNRYRIVGVHTK